MKKIKANKNFAFEGKMFKADQEYELDAIKANFLIANGFATDLEQPKVIAEQIKLDSPAFGMDKEVVTDKVTAKKTTKKKSVKK